MTAFISRIMDSLSMELVRVRAILRANAIDKQVDDDMVMALLQLYANDQQRVDLVLLELEGMLGKEIRVNDQQIRFEISAFDFCFIFIDGTLSNTQVAGIARGACTHESTFKQQQHPTNHCEN